MIVIHPYKATWPVEFDALRNALARVLGDPTRKIAHIGSTSIPGLAAKDVIDIQVGVDELASDTVSKLSSAGYEYVAKYGSDHVPEGDDGSPDRWKKLFFRSPSGLRPCHIHVRVRHNPNHRYALLFREYLRAHVEARMTMELIKRELARLHRNDTDAYYAIKDPVNDLGLQAANEWAAHSGWHQDAAPDA